MQNPSALGFAAISLLLAGLGACEKPDPQAAASMPYPESKVVPGGRLLAQVGPVAITSNEVADRINRQSPFLRGRFKDREKKREFAEQEVHFEVLAQEAWRRRLYQDERMVKELKKLMVARLVETEVEQRLAAEIGEAELRAAYAAAQDEYNKPERIRLSRIVRFVEKEADRKNARALLDKVKEDVLAEEKKGNVGAFDAAVTKYTEDDRTRPQGGELDFRTRDELVQKYGEEVTKVVFDEAKVGDIFSVDTPDAVILFRKSGRRRAVERSFEQVKPQLMARVQRERRNAAMRAFIDELMQRQGVSLDESAIDAIEVDLSAPEAPHPAGEAHP